MIIGSSSSPLINLVMGFPGSGKTWWLSSKNGLIFDDHPNFLILPEQLSSAGTLSNPIWIAHSRLGLKKYQDLILANLTTFMPNSPCKWWAFANDPEQCRLNLHSRADFKIKPVASTLALTTRLYHLPVGAIVLPVYRPPS